MLRAAAPKTAEYCVDTIYFGGGTPTVLGAERLAALLDLITNIFAVTPDAEITTEANPESAQSTDALHILRRAGFNRLSLGMQSADDRELRAVGRIHTAADTVAAVDAARRAGFDNLSLDLIYALPDQTRTRWQETLYAALALAPEHLSCYALKIEPGTPFWESRDRLAIPDDDTQADMYLEAVSFLAQHGYAQYEISNFAKPGRESRHNLKYWTLGEYLGFGPGAHSDFGGRRFAVARDLGAFLRGQTIYSESTVVMPEERAAERVMLGLRTATGLPAEELAGAEAVLRECETHGLAVLHSGRWRLTPRGFFVSNAIILRVQEVLPFLQTSPEEENL